MNASEIIRALGGPTAVSKAIGAGRSAVSNWPRDGIPARYWPALARLAHNVDGADCVTLDVLEGHRKADVGATIMGAPPTDATDAEAA